MIASRPRRILWNRRRSREWWNNIVLGTYNDDQWLEHFRIRRRTFNVLCDKLRPLLKKKQTHLRQTITVELRVAAALWYLASGTDYRTLAELFGMGKATVHRIVSEVCEAIRTLQSFFINLPKGEKLQEVVEGFKERWGFPQCAGAIDGSHISVTPPSEDSKDYYNRKGSYSIILQAVVDHRSRFTNINVGWPGSVHDARVLRNSTLFHLAENGQLFPTETQEIEGVHIPVMLLGDPAYPLMSWLMKGFPDNGHLSREQRLFNYRLSRARMTVECAFGQLKGRWRCLLKKIEVSITRVPTIISACCVLHNLCSMNDDTFLDAWMQDVEEPVEVNAPDIPVTQERAEGPQCVRRALSLYFDKNPV
ncbi:uncharacterized protein [Paramisgurnus dabryanus]|uniref:uncharacterized protein n=1 Tax=Paramisgurnus dabryanus TaxID=90735 RepID=UPI003CCFB14B